MILQQVLGQTFHMFADSNDAGRDGAFHGNWRTSQEPGDEEFADLAKGTQVTAQCKFSARPSGTLTPSVLGDEIAKIRRLNDQGLCDAYLLLTNLRVTGQTEAWLTSQVEAIGVERSLVLDGRWISQQISKQADLRRYVPRVYGLGDLGQILDDRRLRQARKLLARLKGDLATFVPTQAYRRAADAVADHGFVLLLGEPACGKSTIAATLAMAALDNWGCGVRRVDSADELVAAWDPDGPEQLLFWVDDAFGSIRHDPALTDGWSRRLDQVVTALNQGARVILTSRDYIYRDARPYLKEYAYPRLRENKVVVDITEFTESEKRQILYNHLKAGDQPRRVLESWRPYLRCAAAVERFQPEVARRLAHQAFTQDIPLATGDDLLRYFEHPVAFLSDILRQLSPAARAALTCVYLSGDELQAPIEFTSALGDGITRLGADQAQVLSAFAAMDGTFLQITTDTLGEPVWRFRHPTIREGFAAVVAEDVNAVHIFLDGLDDNELLHQIDCGGATTRGTLIRVPSSLYRLVIPRIRVPVKSPSSWTSPVAVFLESRCSPDFVREWAAYHAAELDRLLAFGMYVDAFWQPRVLALLHQVGVLPDAIRRKAVDRLAEYAMEFDGGWLNGPICRLFTENKRAEILQGIRKEILPDLEGWIDNSAEGYDSDVAPGYRYQGAESTIEAYKDVFKGDLQIVAQLEEAAQYIKNAVDHAHDDYYPPPASRLAGESYNTRFTYPLSGRDEFDDLADDR